jgi:hypothetical protein
MQPNRFKTFFTCLFAHLQAAMGQGFASSK